MANEKVIIDKARFQEIVSKGADYANAAGPRLEKLASIENDLPTVAEEISQSLVNSGLIAESQKAASAQEILDSGVTKFAEVVDFILRRVSEDRTMGKAAEVDNSDRPMTADEAWSNALGLDNVVETRTYG